MNSPLKAFLPENSECPRCHRPFACRADTIQSCQCQSVMLTPTQQTYIAERYRGCLCADCLRVIQQQVE